MFFKNKETFERLFLIRYILKEMYPLRRFLFEDFQDSEGMVETIA